MMYKGRYVAVIEYDFVFDPSQPNAMSAEIVQDFFRSGVVEQGIICQTSAGVFPKDMGACKVTQTYFDMFEVPEEG